MNITVGIGLLLLFVFQCCLTNTVRWAGEHAKDGSASAPIAKWVMMASIAGKVGLFSLFVFFGLAFNWYLAIAAVVVFHLLSGVIASFLRKTVDSGIGYLVICPGGVVLMFVSYLLALTYYMAHW